MPDDKKTTPNREEYWSGRPKSGQTHRRPRRPPKMKAAPAEPQALSDEANIAAMASDIDVKDDRQGLPAESKLPTLQLDPSTAPQAVIEALPHIGPAVAARIIAERQIRPFTNEADFRKRIKGIGPATWALISQYLRFPTEHQETQTSLPAASPPPKAATDNQDTTITDSQEGPQGTLEGAGIAQKSPGEKKPGKWSTGPFPTLREVFTPTPKEDTTHSNPGPDLVNWVKSTLENALAQLDARFNELVERHADSQAHVVPQQPTQEQKHEPPQFNEQHNHEIDDRPPEPQAATATSQLQNLSARLDKLSRQVVMLAANDQKLQNAVGLLNDYSGYLKSQIQQLGDTTQYLTAGANHRTHQNCGSP